MKYLLILLLFACSKNKLELPDEDIVNPEDPITAIGASSYLGDSFSGSIAGYHSTYGGTDYRLFKVPNNFLRWQGGRRGSCNIDQSDLIDLSSLVWGYITQDTVPKRIYPRSYREFKGYGTATEETIYDPRDIEGMHYIDCNHIWIIPQPDTVVIPISPKITAKPWNPYSRYEKGPSLVCIKCHQEKQQVIFHKGNDLEPLPDSVQQIEVDPVTQVPTVIYNAPPIPRIVCPAYFYRQVGYILCDHENKDTALYRWYTGIANSHIQKHLANKTIPLIKLKIVDDSPNPFRVGWVQDRDDIGKAFRPGYLRIIIPRVGDQSENLEDLIHYAVLNWQNLKEMEALLYELNPYTPEECAFLSQEMTEWIMDWNYRKQR